MEIEMGIVRSFGARVAYRCYLGFQRRIRVPSSVSASSSSARARAMRRVKSISFFVRSFVRSFILFPSRAFISASGRAVTDGTDGDAKGKLNQPHGNQHEIERKRKPETVHDLRVKSRHGQDEDCEIEHRSLFIDGVRTEVSVADEVGEQTAGEELGASRRRVIGGDGLLHHPRRDDADHLAPVSHPRSDPLLVLFRRAHHQHWREIFIDDVIQYVTDGHAERDARGKVHSKRRRDGDESHVHGAQSLSNLFRIHRLGDDSNLPHHEFFRCDLLRVWNTVPVFIQLVILRARLLRSLHVAPHDDERLLRRRPPGDPVRLHRRRQRRKVSTKKAQKEPDQRRGKLFRVIRLERRPRASARSNARARVRFGRLGQLRRAFDRRRRFFQPRNRLVGDDAERAERHRVSERHGRARRRRRRRRVRWFFNDRCHRIVVTRFRRLARRFRSRVRRRSFRRSGFTQLFGEHAHVRRPASGRRRRVSRRDRNRGRCEALQRGFSG